MANHDCNQAEARHGRDADTFKDLSGRSEHIKARISPKGAMAGIALVAYPGSTSWVVMPPMKRR